MLVLGYIAYMRHAPALSYVHYNREVRIRKSCRCALTQRDRSLRSPLRFPIASGLTWSGISVFGHRGILIRENIPSS